jgi:putative membrane protein
MRRATGLRDCSGVTLLVTALLFWASILPRRADTRTRIVAIFSLFTTSMHSTLLGALLTLSPTVWYASHVVAAGPAGLSALEDQQLAGLIMWVPAVACSFSLASCCWSWPASLPGSPCSDRPSPTPHPS